MWLNHRGDIIVDCYMYKLAKRSLADRVLVQNGDAAQFAGVPSEAKQRQDTT